MKTALLTGSAGFLGRHLLPKLEAAGYDVCEVDPALSGSLHNFSMHPGVCPVDRYRARIENLVAKEANPIGGYGADYRYDVVVHLAANIPDISERMKGGLSQYQDIKLDYAMAEYLLAHPPREAFVALSSCVAGYPTPGDPYCLNKLVLEAFAASLHRSGVSVALLRPFAGFGPGQSLSYPMSALINRALRRENPLTVWGSLDTERDWTFIDDLCDGIIWAIDRAPRGVPIDLGTGRATKFVDLARMIARIVGYDPTIVADTTKPTSHPRRVADVSLAKAHGFVSRVTLEDGIAATVEYERRKNASLLS